MQEATNQPPKAAPTNEVIYKGSTPTSQIKDEVAVWQNGERFFVCDRDDRTAGREVTLDELKALFAKPYTLIFWRAKSVLSFLKLKGLPIPQRFECAYTETCLSTGGSTRIMSFDNAFDWCWEEGVPADDLHRAYALWWMHSTDGIIADGHEKDYQREISLIREKLAALTAKN